MRYVFTYFYMQHSDGWIFSLDPQWWRGKTLHCYYFLSSHTRLFAYKGKQLCNGRVALSAALTHLFIYSLMPRSAVSRAQRHPNRAPVNLWKGHIITDKGEREREKKKLHQLPSISWLLGGQQGC